MIFLINIGITRNEAEVLISVFQYKNQGAKIAGLPFNNASIAYCYMINLFL
jgi:hypothetical protein